MGPLDKFNEVGVNETERLRCAVYDIERMIEVLKSIKNDISEVKQRLNRLENKVNEEERERIADKWASIKTMGEF